MLPDKDPLCHLEASEIVDRIRGHVLSGERSDRRIKAVAKLYELAHLQGNLDEVLTLISKELTYAQ